MLDRAPPELVTRPYRWLRIRLPQPWSRKVGQLAYLPRLARGHAPTRGVFAEEPLIERLALGNEPLEAVGVGMSERVIEIPWVLRSLSAHPLRRVLDVGTAFSLIVYKRLLVRLPYEVEIADLAPAYVPGLRSHVADVRDLPFASDSFDVAICISTLEHVGMDNANYRIVSGGEGEVQGMRELGRVAQRVLVTVPAGRDENMGWQRQYAPPTFRRVVAETGLRIDRLEVFAHDPARGWIRTNEDAVESRTYGEGASAAASVICADLIRR